MGPLSLTNRLLLYVFSNRNIAGCAFALIGLGLFFTGVIDRLWWVITIALYAGGALLFPEDTATALRARSAMLRGSLVEQLDRLIDTVGKRVPGDALRRLESIRDTVRELLPRLQQWGDSSGAEFQHAQVVTAAVTRDLPETVSNYLLLPAGFTSVAKLEGNKSANVLLTEQLSLLDSSLRRIADDALRDDAEALIVHGKFLQERFAPVAFVPGQRQTSER
ncbi:MAG: hypothetical protein H7125_11150 [Proteobacteria bacterium]|nr:hypothetical protein [Burkholderiales bacterium]